MLRVCLGLRIIEVPTPKDAAQKEHLSRPLAQSLPHGTIEDSSDPYTKLAHELVPVQVSLSDSLVVSD